MNKQRIIILLLLSISKLSLFSQEINVFITRDSIVIGDQFEFWIQSNVPEEDFNWVSESKDLGEAFEIIDRGSMMAREDAQQNGFEQKWMLQAWEEGLQWIPPIDYLIGQDSFKTDSILVPVFPVILDTNQLTVLPDKGLREAPFEWKELRRWWWVPLLLLILIVLAYFMIRRSRQEEIAPEKLQLPDEWAMEQLFALKQEMLPEIEDLKAFYTRLSYILRAYLERRYGIQALEKTTREIMRSPIREIIDREEQYKLRQGLETMDLVKFAKYQPQGDQHEDAWQKIHDFVQLTRQKPSTNQEEPS